MAVSGRAGLFTIDNGPFFYDLRGTPYTAEKRQKSGALRLEFGRIDVADASYNAVSAKTTVNTGIMTVITPSKAPPDPVISVSLSGDRELYCPGSFTSGAFYVGIKQTGSYSGWASGLTINYMIVGY